MMIWQKPQKVWEWLLLVIPAVAALLALYFADAWLSPIPPLELSDGHKVMNIQAEIARELTVTIAPIVICSFALAVVVARGENYFDRLLNTVAVTVVLVVVNSFVAFGGCTLFGFVSSSR